MNNNEEVESKGLFGDHLYMFGESTTEVCGIYNTDTKPPFERVKPSADSADIGIRKASE